MIDFSNIKSIVIPEGEVSVIARGSEVLWRKPSEKLLRYIKFVVNSVRSVGGTQMQFSEIEFLDAVGNRFNYPATTTVTSPDMPPTATAEGQNKIIDGLTSTKFCTIKFTSGKYLLIDLGEAVLDVQKYCNWQWWTGNDNYARDPISFELWGSEDGDTYERLDSAVKVDVPTARQVVAYTGKIKTTPYKTELTYLEGTGTQYIDTGMYAPLNTDIEVKFQLNNTSQVSSNNGAVFGGRTGTTINTCTLFYLASTNPQYFRFDRAGQQQIGLSSEITINPDSEYVFEYVGNKITTKNLTTSEETSKTLSNPSSLTTVPIYLFAVNTSGTAGTFLKGRVYEWKYWENGVLIQHFIPVLDHNDVPCMYDKVSEELFYNQGTGEFLYA